MNYFEIIKKVAVLPGVNLKEPQAFDTVDLQVIKIKNAVNNALKTICSCWDWNFRLKKKLITISPDIREYEWSDGRIINIYIQQNNENPFELVYEPNCSLLNQYGNPFCYSIEFDKIILFPTPYDSCTCIIYYLSDNLAVSGDGLTEKNLLEAATDLPVVPEKFQDILIYKAALNYFSKPAKKEYPYYLSQYYERLNQAKIEDKGTKSDTPSIELSGRSTFSKRFL
jgi:hypothetical protein